MPNARARLEPTTSMTVAPTTASTICVSMTGAERGGVPRRRGRNASAAPSAVATGSASTARSTMSKWDSSTCGSDCASSGGGGCMTVCRASGSARSLIDRSRAQRGRVVNLLLDLVDEPLCVLIGVVGSSKRVVPLLVGKARHALGGPAYVRRPNHRNQFLMPSRVVEFDVVAVEGGDKAMPLEALEAIAFRIQLAGVAQCGAQISDDKPPRRTLGGFLVDVRAVVVVLLFGAVI